MEFGNKPDAGISLSDLSSSSLFLPTSSTLPILQHEQSVGKLLNEYPSLCILAETSSGKSTQLPQMLYRLGWCKNGFKIAVVQPNRLTATRLASRLATEFANDSYCELLCSEEIPKINQRRRQNCPITVFDQISFLKLGFGVDPKLSEYSLIFLDEIHERAINMEMIFGLLRRLMEVRQELRLVLASATIDMKSVTRYFPNCATIVCEGRQYPVYVSYLKEATSNYLRTCSQVVKHIHKYETRGDILIFVATREDSEELGRMIQEEEDSIICVPLHSGMTLKDQQLVISASSSSSSSTHKRKCIVSTQIAETSVSIPNIVFVIDTLYSLDTTFDPISGLNSIVVRSVSKSKADQRTGRAGRNCPGKCFRLCTESMFRQLKHHDEPEILRSDLVDVILSLKSLGVKHVVDFPFMSSPSSEVFIKAFDILFALGAIDEGGELTMDGQILSQLPLPANLGKLLLKAFQMQEEGWNILGPIVDLVSVIASGVASSILAVCSQQNLATNGSREGDHLTLLNMLQQAETGKPHIVQSESLTRFRTFRKYLKYCISSIPPLREILLKQQQRNDEGHTVEG